MTMATILKTTAHECARRAWERASIASSLRRAAHKSGNWRSARLLSQVKSRAVQRVATILPEEIRAQPHHVEGHDLVFINFGRRGLHLPAAAAPQLA